jgi:MT0933-like antitoxin protein
MTSDHDRPVTDRIKQLVDELDLETKIAAAVAAGEQAVLRGVEVVGDYAHQHRDDIDTLLDRAGSAVDSRTDGRYADRVGRLRSQVSLGVAKLAEHRPEGHQGTDEAPRPIDGPEA